MGFGDKIATCCYCGARTALSLKGTTRHELACSSCGAPLHDLKQMPISKPHDGPVKPATVKPSRIRVKPDDPIKGYKWDRKKDRKRKKKKSKFTWLAEKIWDELEDVFD